MRLLPSESECDSWSCHGHWEVLRGRKQNLNGRDGETESEKDLGAQGAELNFISH